MKIVQKILNLSLQLSDQTSSRILHVFLLAGDQNGNRLVLRLVELDFGVLNWNF